MNHKSILGHFQKNILVFGINRKYLTSAFTFFTGALTMFGSQIITPLKSGTSITYSILITVGSLLLGVYTFIIETMDRVKKQNEHIEITPDNYLNHIIDHIELDDHYTKNGYMIYSYNNEFYLMSNEINERLITNSDKIQLKLAGDFSIPHEVTNIVPFAVKKAFERKSFLFNGKLVRLVDDFTIENLEKNTPVRIQNTTYFQGLCTNEVVYRRIKDMRSINAKVFEGYKITYKMNEDNNFSLISMMDSFGANYLGGSTLAITKDNYIVITKNPKRADVNGNMLVPSGSGSTDQKDIKVGDSYGSLIKRTMERELREECSIKKKIKLKTIVLGHARLLNRGGKPDFWGITYIDGTIKDIKPSKKEIKEMGEYSHQFIKFNNTSEIISKLEQLVENEQSISLQLMAMTRILKYFDDKKIDVWSMIS